MGVLALTGELTFATASDRLKEAQAALDGNGDGITIELSGVTRADSAGLSLLLELTRQAKARQRPLRLAGAPKGLRELAAFFGIDEMLALGA